MSKDFWIPLFLIVSFAIIGLGQAASIYPNPNDPYESFTVLHAIGVQMSQESCYIRCRLGGFPGSVMWIGKRKWRHCHCNYKRVNSKQPVYLDAFDLGTPSYQADNDKGIDFNTPVYQYSYIPIHVDDETDSSDY